MRSTELIGHLGKSLQALGDDFFRALGTIARPALDEDVEQRYDWVLIKKKGIELGFADTAYFAGADEGLWGTQGLSFTQVTFYSDSRQGVKPYTGELPMGLVMSDTREQARAKLADYEASRHSYKTDRWDIGRCRLVVAHKPCDKGLDSVHVKLPIYPLDEAGREQPVVDAAAWLQLFGLRANSPELRAALKPLDVPARIEDHEDDREVDFIDECGLSLYFENANQLRPARGPDSGKGLAFGAVKFYRARDYDAREYTGGLPFALEFADSPETLLQKVGHKPAKHTDGQSTGRALWHFDRFSLQVLYSTVENHLFRVMFMAPGYWQEMRDLPELDEEADAAE